MFLSTIASTNYEIGIKMNILKIINSKMYAVIEMIAKKKIIKKLHLHNIDLDNFTLQEFDGLVGNEKYIVVCNYKRIVNDIAIGMLLGMWLYIFVSLWFLKAF